MAVNREQWAGARARDRQIPGGSTYDDRLILFGVRLSRCCNSRTRLIRSRQGGFIGQVCLKCLVPKHVNPDHIPNLDCQRCKASEMMTVTTINKNYWFKCDRCKYKWEIASALPHWSDLFPECGLSAPGDGTF